MEPSSEITSELESFREQWRAEVKAKQEPAKPSSSSARAGKAAVSVSNPAHKTTSGASRPLGASTRQPIVHDHDDDGYEHTFDHPGGGDAAPTEVGQAVPEKEPVTALEHYELAVKKEDAGSLGDSLRLYRTAFKMDDAVDKKYKNKHFPTVAPPPFPKGVHHPGDSVAILSSQSTSQPTPQTQPQKSAYVQPPITDLLASFAQLGISPEPPAIEGTPAPPCPVAALPEEILVHILRDVAVSDIGDFVRLALVCRRLAYLVATEEPVWRRVCEGKEWGHAAMRRKWNKAVNWGDLEEEPRMLGTSEDEPKADDANTPSLISQYGSWKTMFRLRPRIRFNGVYICTVNYIRMGSNAGVEAANQGPGRSARNFSWTNPVHIVTYYRYLRFFRDGTVLSLLTTSEPKEVVHHLTRAEALAARPEAGKGRTRIGLGAASSVSVDVGGLTHSDKKDLRRGRWRLGKGDEQVGGAPSRSADMPVGTEQRPMPLSEQDDEAESNLYVESEGISGYIYRMELALRGGGARSGDMKGDAKGNNSKKLIWRGFYSYNMLTDDWGVFTLKNDKPFFFSRVRSYGNGE